MPIDGVSGAGKSTVARRVVHGFERGVHLHTDDFWQAIVTGGIPPYLSAADDQNHTVMDVIAAASYSYARGGFTTLIDGVIGPSMLPHFRPYLHMDPDIPLHYIVLRPDRDTTLERARSRTSAEALTDPAALSTMWRHFADLGAFEAHVINTTTHHPAETATDVAGVLNARSHLLARIPRQQP